MLRLTVIILLLLGGRMQAQTAAAKLYNPAANADIEIAQALKQAKAQKRMVFLQVGGNWCSWCHEFNRFTSADKSIDSMLRADYIVYHLNYSPENKNHAILARYGYPQRFGFPVFIVLDENGNRVHTQNSSYLEQGKSYNTKKVIEFLSQWNRKALTPGEYRNQ